MDELFGSQVNLRSSKSVPTKNIGSYLYKSKMCIRIICKLCLLPIVIYLCTGMSISYILLKIYLGTNIFYYIYFNVGNIGM